MTERRNAIFHGGQSRNVLEAILNLHFPGSPLIADLTWGKGAFWNSQHVISLDIQPRRGCQIQADSRSVPLADKSVDVAVFDPPFMHGKGSTTSTLSLGDDYLRMKDQRSIRQLYYDTWPELTRIARKGVIIKCADTIESGKLNPTHADLIAKFGWPFDMAILDSGVVRPMRPGSRVLHFKPAHSYFLVWIQ